MRVGVLMLPTDPWPETLARARHIEELGYDHLWTYDHLSWRHYRGRRWFASLPWLTGIAGATNRIRLGTMVATPNFRQPVPFAQETVTLDHVSAGRLILGLGAGGVGFDSTVFGREPLSRRERVDRLAEFVEILELLYAQPTVSHNGTYFTVNEAVVEPAAIQTPRIPFAIAATGKRSLAIVARHGDAWITFGDARDTSASGTAEIVREQSRELDDACAAIGRDPATIQRIYMVGTTDERPLASTSAFEDFIGRYAALGFTDLVVHHPRDDDPAWDEPATIIDEIAADVLPNWRS